jgi:hypothetical protein
VHLLTRTADAADLTQGGGEGVRLARLAVHASPAAEQAERAGDTSLPIRRRAAAQHEPSDPVTRATISLLAQSNVTPDLDPYCRR